MSPFCTPKGMGVLGAPPDESGPEMLGPSKDFTNHGMANETMTDSRAAKESALVMPGSAVRHREAGSPEEQTCRMPRSSGWNTSGVSS